jgi:rubrerythrin
MADQLQERTADRVMMSAHALCPLHLSHPDKMRWMAAYFLENYSASSSSVREEARNAALEEAKQVCGIELATWEGDYRYLVERAIKWIVDELELRKSQPAEQAAAPEQRQCECLATGKQSCTGPAYCTALISSPPNLPKRQRCSMCGYVGIETDHIGQCPQCHWDELSPAPMQSSSQPTDAPSVIESVIACLDDDAAALFRANPDCEIAANMMAAADLLETLQSSAPLLTSPKP